ncbi:hypothetical protein ACH437_15370 [Streptomyces xinghaiensis]|uniref:hypothetical protein n=1 Tax=Streptomyces xinghaiensis TaxID=1038928 RepID=UPI0037B8D6A8
MTRFDTGRSRAVKSPKDGVAFTMKLTLDGHWNATVTGDPLRITPRFDFPGQCVRIAEYADVEEWQRFLTDTFGSHEWLWDDPDELRFTPDTRELAGAAFRLPYESAPAEDRTRLPAAPPVHPGGLRADEARDFRLEVTTEFCRAPGDTVLTCLRNLDVLDEPLDARIGIAPDVAIPDKTSASGAIVISKRPGHSSGSPDPDAHPLRSPSSTTTLRTDRPSEEQYKRPGQKGSDLVVSGAAFGIRTRDLRITRP